MLEKVCLIFIKEHSKVETRLNINTKVISKISLCYKYTFSKIVRKTILNCEIWFMQYQTPLADFFISKLFVYIYICNGGVSSQRKFYFSLIVTMKYAIIFYFL